MTEKPTIQEYWKSVFAERKVLTHDQINAAMYFAKSFDMELILSTDIIILRNRGKKND